ncbi:MAG: class I SAM-dependent methyltransferase [Phycisphaerales bacterium]
MNSGTPAGERISHRDGSLVPGYGIHIQRYNHALPHCAGGCVLDAGCGIGYGSAHLASRGAARVIGVDIAEEALAEARAAYRRPNLSFVRADLMALDAATELPASFDTIVNLENIEHLPDPERFLVAARSRLDPARGVLVVSTPNGRVTARDATGEIRNPFHEKEYAPDELRALLGRFFPSVHMSGQWRTPDGLLRTRSAEEAFRYRCDAYFNPTARLGRLARRAIGYSVLPPPVFVESGDSYSTDTAIAALDEPPYEWEPAYLLAVCRVR